MMGKRNRGDLISQFAQQGSPGLDRFAVAEQIQQRMPTGLSVATSDAEQPTEKAEAPAPEFEVPVEKTVSNPLNARFVYREQRIVDLASSILKHQQLSPALCCSKSDFLNLVATPDCPPPIRQWSSENITDEIEYVVLGGHYRRQACKRLGRGLIVRPVKVKSVMDLYALSYTENDEREGATPLDDALAWQNLIDMGLAPTHEQIADVTGKSRAVITKTLALLKLPSDAIELLREAPGEYSYKAAYVLTQLLDQVDQPRLLELTRQVAHSEITLRTIEALLADGQSTERKPRKKKENSRQHKLLRDGQSVGFIKDWDSGKVVLEIQIFDQEQREALVADLRRRLGGEGA